MCGDNFVQKLNKFYNFDNNIFLFTDPAVLQKVIYDNDVSRTTTVLFKGKNSERINLFRIALSCGKNCVLFVFKNHVSTSTKPFQLNATEFNATMQLLYWNRKIKVGFIITTDVVNAGSMKFVKDIIDWSWSNLLIDMFVLLRTDDNDQVFTFNPYKSKDEIIQIEPNQLWMYFHEKSSNLYGYQMRLTFSVEVDFLIYTSKGFKSKDGKMCEYILNGLNATYSARINATQAWNSFVRQVIAGEADFSPRRYSIQNIHVPVSRVFTYPVGTEKYILLVPSARPYNQFGAFFKNFTINNSIINIMGPILLIIAILWAFKAFKYRESMLLQSVVEVIGLLFTVDVEGTRNLTDMDVRLFLVSLSVGGFFFMNTILSIFISLLLQPLMHSEINSFDQFDETSLKIKVPSAEFVSHMLELAALNKRDWKNRIEVSKSINENVNQIYNYDTRFAYYYSSIRTDILLERQRRLPIRGFHVPRQYLRTALNAYAIGSRAPFRERVDYLIMQAFSAGLYDKWKRDTFGNLTETGYFDRFEVINDELEQTFAIPFMIFYGYVLSIVVFLFECGYFNLKKRCGRNNNLERCT